MHAKDARTCQLENKVGLQNMMYIQLLNINYSKGYITVISTISLVVYGPRNMSKVSSTAFLSLP